MTKLLANVLRGAQVKEGTNYHANWNFSRGTSKYKSLYNQINQSVMSLLGLPIVSWRQLKPQLRSKDTLYNSVTKSTATYDGNDVLLYDT